MSIPVVYGEGDKAFGRFLAQLLTSSEDTSILAWAGRSGGFNSCLPASIAVFNQFPISHIPLALERAEMDGIIARLRSSPLDSTSSMRLYDRLHELPVLSFVGQRMKLPCLNFKLGRLSAVRSKSGHVFRAQTAIGVEEIRTEENLSRIGSLYLIHPWIDFLLDQQPVGSLTEMIPEENTNDRTSSICESFSLCTALSTASLQPPLSLSSTVERGRGRSPLAGRRGGSPNGWTLTTQHDTDYLLRGRQPLRQDPWHRSEGLPAQDLVPRIQRKGRCERSKSLLD